MDDDLYKKNLIEKVGEEEFKKQYDTLKKLATKEEKLGVFKAMEGALDSRTEEQIGDFKNLH